MTDSQNYSQEMIEDNAVLGASPSKDYLDHVDMLDNVVRECMYVSQSYAGLAAPTSKHFYASVLFTAMITKGVTLAQMMPFTPWAEKRIEHWDYASATGVTRTMLELRIAFFYLCTEACSEEEWQCRWNLFNLHDCKSRIRLFEATGSDEQVASFVAHSKDLSGRLQSNVFFQQLPLGQQRSLLNGQKAYLFSLEDIAERAGIEKDTFRWIYILFSSHVHALPMSFYRIGSGSEERGRGLPSQVEERYTSLCLTFASTFLTSTRDEVHALFGEFKDLAEEKLRQAVLEQEKSQKRKEQEISSGGPAIGESIILDETPDIVIEVTRTGIEDCDIAYRYKVTNDIILKSTDSKENGIGLQEFDSFFWNVLIDGRPATEPQMFNLKELDWIYKVDHISRTLAIKTRPKFPELPSENN